jgi:hypothetical protein
LVLALDTTVLELEKLNETKCGKDELWKEVDKLGVVMMKKGCFRSLQWRWGREKGYRWHKSSCK